MLLPGTRNHAQCSARVNACSLQNNCMRAAMLRLGKGLWFFLSCKMTGEPATVSRMLAEDMKLLGQRQRTLLLRAIRIARMSCSCPGAPSSSSHRVTFWGLSNTLLCSGLYDRKSEFRGLNLSWWAEILPTLALEGETVCVFQDCYTYILEKPVPLFKGHV